MKIFPIKPMSTYDRLKNLMKIMEYNQKLQSKTNAKVLSNTAADKFVKNVK